MPLASQPQVALLGNPNTGKTTLFNALTGSRHQTGNYPGVTVEWKAGQWPLPGGAVELVDLPGAYSLTPRSPDEAVARDALMGRIAGRRRPDLAVVLLNAGSIQRGLYLLSQAKDAGVPVVVALNMVDVAESKGIAVDPAALAANLGMPVVPVHARRRQGLPQLALAVEAALKAPAAPSAAGVAPAEDTPAAVRARHAWARAMQQGAVRRPARGVRTASDRLDAVLTHPVWGLLAFVLVSGLMFQALFSWSAPLAEGIAGLVSRLGAALGAALPAGMLRSLLVDGVLAGVGGVLGFAPQVALLFVFIAALEDCGYMARAALLADRLLRPLGLSGRSFIPLLSSFACTVPGVMAARIIGSRRERLAAMLLAPLMSCSARLPVYTLMIAAFVPARALWGPLTLQGAALVGMYLLGVAVAVPVAWALKRLVLRGEPGRAFMIELPHYHWPEPRTVLLRAWTQVAEFLRRAATLIVAVAVVVWALCWFPRPQAVHARYQEARQQTLAAQPAGPQREASLRALDSREAGEYLRQSWMARAGRALEPAFTPLGWDWRITMAALASFPAREVVVATLGTLFNLDGEGAAEDLPRALRAARRPDGAPLFSLAVAVSIMVFFALCAQCAATLVVLKNEAGWRYAALAFTFMTVLAWAGGALAYHAVGWFA